MKTNFYFIRHGLTDTNLRQLWSGKKIEDVLNPQGIKQVKDLSEKIDSLCIERLYTSNQKQAVQTARLISHRCEIPVYIQPELQAVDYGKVEGWPTDKVIKQYPKTASLWNRPQPQSLDNHFDGGECPADVWQRVHPLLEKIASYQRDKLKFAEWRIGLVTHAGVIGSMMAALGVESPAIDNCDVIHITFDEKGYQYEGKLF